MGVLIFLAPVAVMVARKSVELAFQELNKPRVRRDCGMQAGV